MKEKIKTDVELKKYQKLKKNWAGLVSGKVNGRVRVFITKDHTTAFNIGVSENGLAGEGFVVLVFVEDKKRHIELVGLD